jgi:hypothetical protein
MKQESTSDGIRSLLDEKLKIALEKNPDIKAIRWLQYTTPVDQLDNLEIPEFIVGPPCFTNAENEDLQDIEWNSYLGDNENIFCLSISENDDKEEMSPDFLDINSCWDLMELITSPQTRQGFLDLFGDPSEVTVTKQGITVAVIE